MKGPSLVVLILVLIALAGGAGFWFGHHSAGEKSEADAPTTQESDDEKPVVSVVVAPVRQEAISETITAYGTVSADPAEVRVLSVPFESRVGRVLATPGQQVSPDSEVLQLDASPDAQVAMQDAKNSFEAAGRDLQQTEQRFADHLATNQEISAAQQALKSAKLKLDSLEERGVGKTQHLKPPLAGVVNKVDVQEGQIVPAGGPLMEIAAENRIQVKLGVEPDDAAVLKVGQAVKLHRVEGSSGEEIEGKIRVIGNRVDPATRLIDVLVTLPADAHLVLETFVAGKLTRESAEGLVVPRDAILSEEDGGFSLFTIKDDHAVKHTVKTGLETRRDVQIISDDVKPGDTVAILGNFVLEDKMEVEVKKPATEPAEPKTESKQAEAP
jgi:membrane fusion protein, multidrug efflux system